MVEVGEVWSRGWERQRSVNQSREELDYLYHILMNSVIIPRHSNNKKNNIQSYNGIAIFLFVVYINNDINVKKKQFLQQKRK